MDGDPPRTRRATHRRSQLRDRRPRIAPSRPVACERPNPTGRDPLDRDSLYRDTEGPAHKAMRANRAAAESHTRADERDAVPLRSVQREVARRGGGCWTARDPV